MNDTPPRRSRRSPQPPNDSSFPLVPFLIGIVILGLVIGAGLSLARQRVTTRQDVASDLSPVPSQAATPTVAPATLAPLATERPATPSPAATPDLATASPRAVPSASAKPSLLPSASASPSHAPAPKPSERVAAVSPQPASPSPRASVSAVAVAAPPVRASAAATAVKTSEPAAAVSSPRAAPASAAPASMPGIDADTDFGRLSASVVRQYLRALARGDTASAAGALGDAPGSSDAAFPEQSIMDSSAQIGTLVSRGSNETQTVQVTITSGSGTYNGTYTVHRTPTGAAVITAHSINKS